MTTNHCQIAVRKSCPLCGCSHLGRALDGRQDYEYGVPVTLPYSVCKNPSCGLVFAATIPSIEVIQGFYSKYSTHSGYRPPSRIASIIASFNARVREKRLLSLFKGAELAKLNVLDYGCGAGEFMRQLKTLGIGRVVGYDFDAMACKHAREIGLTAVETENEFQAKGPYDFIFLNHVIEHLAEPANSLANIARNLKPGGRIVMRTPNANSFLAQLFRKSWRGWETPRHLHIFNANSIRQLVAKADIPGARIVEVNTSNEMFVGMFQESFHGTFWRSAAVGKLLRKLSCIGTLPVAYAANVLSHGIGEEVCIVIEITDAGRA